MQYAILGTAYSQGLHKVVFNLMQRDVQSSLTGERKRQQLSYQYFLSKRTELQAFIDNDGQAFITMNDPQWIEAARKLAERAMKAAPAREARLDFLARATIGRPLEAREAKVLFGAAETFRAKFAGDAESVKALLAIGESKPNESLPAAEIAQWTMVASQFLNLDEFLTK